MFDWNDEELAVIIWGEASEGGDHIVPYAKGHEQKLSITFGDQSKKQWDQDSNTIKTVEKKTPEPKNDSTVCRPESNSQFNTNEFSAPGFDMDSWPDLPLSVAECGKGYVDRNGQDSISEVSNFNPERADTAQLDTDHELFVDEHVDKEGGFHDYGWDNIGNFDDLDTIFRNDDSIFGRDCLGNADELWSSADVISSPAKSFPLSAGSPSSGFGALKNMPQQCEVKMEFVPQESQCSTPGNGKMDDHDSHNLHNFHLSRHEVAAKQSCLSGNSLVECAAGGSKTLMEDKTTPEEIEKTEASNSQSPRENNAPPYDFADQGSKQKKSQIKSEEKCQGKVSQDLCGAWSPIANQFQQFGKQFATSALQTFSPSVLSPRQQIAEPDSLRYLQTSDSYFPAGYESQAPLYPCMPPVQHPHPERDKHYPLLVGHEFSPRSAKHASALRNSQDISNSSLIMTPQEKIEKLRRRQQMQAMLAIQKQQQQFTHQATCTNQSMTQNCWQEAQSEDTVGTNIEAEENLKIPPSVDPTSPVEQDDSNTISMVVDECSLEESILNQLLEVIGKLDIRIRLCLRDSLYRLAQSAMLRQSAADTSSTNKSSGDENEAFAIEESNSHNRSTSGLDAETETNPIDRTVAHLLFYNPTESSARPVQDGEIPKSPICKLPSEPKRESLVNLPMKCLTESSAEKQSVSHPGAKSRFTFPEAQHKGQFRGSPYINTPENASQNEPEDRGIVEVEASK